MSDNIAHALCWCFRYLAVCYPLKPSWHSSKGKAIKIIIGIWIISLVLSSCWNFLIRVINLWFCQIYNPCILLCVPLKYINTYHNVNFQVAYLYYNPTTFMRKQGYNEDSSQNAGFIRIEQSAKCVMVSICVEREVEKREEIRDIGVLLWLQYY